MSREILRAPSIPPPDTREMLTTGGELLYALCYHLACCIDYYRAHKGEAGLESMWRKYHADGEICISLHSLHNLNRRVGDMESQGYCMMDALVKIHKGKVFGYIRRRHDKRVRRAFNKELNRQAQSARRARRSPAIL